MHKHYYKNYYDKLSDAKDYLRAMVNREKGLKKLLRNCKSGDYEKILTLESQVRFVQEKIGEQCRYLDMMMNNKPKI